MKERIFVLGEKGTIKSSISTDDLKRIVVRLEQATKKLQIDRESRVILCFRPEYGDQFLCTFLACMRANIIAVPVAPFNPLSKNDSHYQKFLNVLKDCQADVVLTDDSFFNRPFYKVVKSKFGFNDENQISFIDFKSLLSSTPDSKYFDLSFDLFSFLHTNEDKIAYLQYTSGSTGEPKGVKITLKMLKHNFQLLSHYARIEGPKARTISWVPLFHDLGLVMSLLTIYWGGSLYLLSPLTFMKDPLIWIKSLSLYKATSTASPNFALSFVCKRYRETREKLSFDLSSMKDWMIGGEPVMLDDLRSFINLFSSHHHLKESCLHPCYGLAEHTLAITGHVNDHIQTIFNIDQEEYVVVGNASSEACDRTGNVIILIVNPQSFQILQDGEVGEIWVNSDSVTSGYWERQDASDLVLVPSFDLESKNNCNRRIAIKGNYLRTGDLGFVCDGKIAVCGRLSEIIIYQGKNYFPADIEHCLIEEFNELRAGGIAVVPFRVQQSSTDVFAVISEINSDQNRHLNFQMLTRKIVSHLELRQGIPSKDIFVGLVEAKSLPKTSSGKMKRKMIQKNLQSETIHFIARFNPILNSSFLNDQSKFSANIKKQQKTEVRVGIIGAGAFSLSLALKLSDQWSDRSKLHITILEQDNVIGGMGRCVEIDGIPIHVGAHMIFPSSYPLMMSLFKRFQIPLVDDFSEVILSSGNKINQPSAPSDIDKQMIVDLIKSNDPSVLNKPISEWIEESPDNANLWDKVGVQFYGAGYGKLCDNIPLRYLIYFLFYTNSHSRMYCPDGLDKLWFKIAKDISTNENHRILTSCSIVNVERSSNSHIVKISYQLGERLKEIKEEFDVLVIAHSLEPSNYIKLTPLEEDLLLGCKYLPYETRIYRIVELSSDFPLLKKWCFLSESSSIAVFLPITPTVVVLTGYDLSDIDVIKELHQYGINIIDRLWDKKWKMALPHFDCNSLQENILQKLNEINNLGESSIMFARPNPEMELTESSCNRAHYFARLIIEKFDSQNEEINDFANNNEIIKRNNKSLEKIIDKILILQCIIDIKEEVSKDLVIDEDYFLTIDLAKIFSFSLKIVQFHNELQTLARELIHQPYYSLSFDLILNTSINQIAEFLLQQTLIMNKTNQHNGTSFNNNINENNNINCDHAVESDKSSQNEKSKKKIQKNAKAREKKELPFWKYYIGFGIAYFTVFSWLLITTYLTFFVVKLIQPSFNSSLLSHIFFSPLPMIFYLIFAIMIAIIFKKYLIRWSSKPGDQIPIRSWGYLRWWTSKTILTFCGTYFFWALQRGEIYSIFLRHLGANIGKNVYIPTIITDPDLVDIGNNVVINQDVLFRFQEFDTNNGNLIFGKGIKIGNGATIMPGAVLNLNCAINEGVIVSPMQIMSNYLSDNNDNQILSNQNQLNDWIAALQNIFRIYFSLFLLGCCQQIVIALFAYFLPSLIVVPFREIVLNLGILQFFFPVFIVVWLTMDVTSIGVFDFASLLISLPLNVIFVSLFVLTASSFLIKILRKFESKTKKYPLSLEIIGMIQVFVVPYIGAELFFIWLRSLGAKIGNKVVLNAHPLVTSYHPENLIINNGAHAASFPHCSFLQANLNGNHRWIGGPIVIEENALLGAGCVQLPFSRIPKRSIVSVCSCVKSDDYLHEATLYTGRDKLFSIPQSKVTDYIDNEKDQRGSDYKIVILDTISSLFVIIIRSLILFSTFCVIFLITNLLSIFGTQSLLFFILSPFILSSAILLKMVVCSIFCNWINYQNGKTRKFRRFSTNFFRYKIVLALRSIDFAENSYILGSFWYNFYLSLHGAKVKSSAMINGQLADPDLIEIENDAIIETGATVQCHIMEGTVPPKDVIVFLPVRIKNNAVVQCKSFLFPNSFVSPHSIVQIFNTLN